MIEKNNQRDCRQWSVAWNGLIQEPSKNNQQYIETVTLSDLIVSSMNL